MRQANFYRGTLTPQQIADGLNAIGRNARRLHDDAKFMFDAKRYPSACSIAVLSIEESGKIPILRQLATAGTKQATNKAWRAFGDHREKNAHWIFAQEVSNGARTLCDFNKLYDRASDHPELLDRVKQIGLYVDCYGKAHWSEPQDVIEEPLAKAIVFASGVLLQKREVNVREIELWIKHMGMDWNNRRAIGKLYAFEKAMIDEGLSEHTLEEIERFLGIRQAA